MKKNIKGGMIALICAIIVLTPLGKILLYLFPPLEDHDLILLLAEIGCLFLGLALFMAVSTLIKKKKGAVEVAQEETETETSEPLYHEKFGRIEFVKGAILCLVTWLVLNISFLRVLGIKNEFLLANDNFVVYAFLFVLFLVAYWKMIVDIIKTFAKDKRKKQKIEQVFIAAGVVIVVSVACFIILDKLQVSNPNEEGLSEWTESSAFLSLLTCVLLAPVTEELNYRFFWFRSFGKINRIFAHIATAILFGAIHVTVPFLMTGDWKVLLNLIPYAVMGLGMSITYEKNHSLIYSFMLHALINLLATFGNIF